MNEIFAPIKDEMHHFQQFYQSIIAEKQTFMSSYINATLQNTGKMLRPAMVFLSAGTCGEITEKTYHIAALVELLHNSSLIHDDVVDVGEKRRNNKTINVLYGNQIAVLIGDFLLSKCMQQITFLKDLDLLADVSRLAENMINGELLQLNKKISRNITLSQYFEIIGKKTAKLMAFCCRWGAISAQKNKKNIDDWYEIGWIFGLIFQMADDLLDYTSSNNGEKDAYKDIKEHKITIPLILALQNMNSMQQKNMQYRFFHHQASDSEIAAIIQDVVAYGGIEETLKLMQEKSKQLFYFLQKQQDSVYKHSLIKMIEWKTNAKID